METGYMTIDVDRMKAKYFDDFVALVETDASPELLHRVVKEAADFYNKCLELAEGEV